MGGGAIRFLGKQPQNYIAEHLKDYDLFVQPSRYEGFVLTVAEAMCAKLPVLVSSGQGSAEVTENDRYGWIFKNGDIDDLINKIVYIRNHYDEVINKIDITFEHVRKRYDVSITAKSYLGHYCRNR